MATPPFIPNIPSTTSTNSGGFFNSPLFGGILAGLGGLATGILGNQAASAQANAATNASHESNQLLAAIYGQNRADQMPFTQAGYGAVGKLSDYFGLNPQRYTQSSSTATGQQNPAIDESMFPMGRGSLTDNSIGYSGGVAYPILDRSADGGVTDNSNLPTLSQLYGGGGQSPYMYDTTGAGTSGVPQNGGQLPADFGSMNHDFSLADFNADPGYDFTKSEGQKAIDRSAAARGSVLGGGTIKAQTRYADNLASTHFNDAFNRYQVNRTNKINPLFTLAGYGLQSANQVANSGTQLAGQGANINFNGGVDAGAARASGYASTANAINNGLSNIYSLSKYGRIG